MKKILAIGGAVIKTAKPELREVIIKDKIEMLIHNGGSIFHDFQQAIDENLKSHSYPIKDLLVSMECNRRASELVWDWLDTKLAPDNSITKLCHEKNIPVLLFTGLACDFWHMFGDQPQWSKLGSYTYGFFDNLVNRFEQDIFHYICMGSAVIHPEVFIKALAQAQLKHKFFADVVDFKDMYRPKTRIAQFGKYYLMTHKEFLTQWPE